MPPSWSLLLLALHVLFLLPVWPAVGGLLPDANLPITTASTAHQQQRFPVKELVCHNSYCHRYNSTTVASPSQQQLHTTVTVTTVAGALTTAISGVHMKNYKLELHSFFEF
jgi:hypothetical protein